MFRKKKDKLKNAPEPEKKPEFTQDSKEIVTFEEVSFAYEISADTSEADDGNKNGDGIRLVQALSGISMEVRRGEFLAVIGRNGSGKSTLAKLMNALLIPSEGTVIVDGINTAEDGMEWEIRSRVGMVFQNPDNQIIGATVEEDIAFGLENLGVPRPEMIERIASAAETTGLSGLEQTEPHLLSGGQKQRVAIAGILAMRPDCIVLDEATAMLDPSGRREVMKVASSLNKDHGITIVHITHHMDEVALCDRAIVINQGTAVLEGTPSELFSHPDKMRECGLEVPPVTALCESLRDAGVDTGSIPITVEAAIPVLKELLLRESDRTACGEESMLLREQRRRDAETRYTYREGPNSIDVDNISYTYGPGTPFENKALENISFSIGDGEFVGIIGHTGCGKSTLVQHLNGLLKPSEGTVSIGGEAMGDANVKTMRRRVGLVFQYPEYQLFESTVARDVAFGIRNDGLSEEETAKRVDEALRLVGLDPAEIREKSIYDISGGQKRRVAIAGILVMRPGILVLDEPAAGLDPAGRNEILGICRDLNKNSGNTVILVSHNMDDVALNCDRILVMDNKRVRLLGTKEEVFDDAEELESIGLSLPEITKLFIELSDQLPDLHISKKIFSVSDAVDEILRLTGKNTAEREDNVG